MIRTVTHTDFNTGRDHYTFIHERTLMRVTVTVDAFEHTDKALARLLADAKKELQEKINAYDLLTGMA